MVIEATDFDTEHLAIKFKCEKNRTMKKHIYDMQDECVRCGYKVACEHDWTGAYELLTPYTRCKKCEGIAHWTRWGRDC